MHVFYLTECNPRMSSSALSTIVVPVNASSWLNDYSWTNKERVSL